MAYATVSDVQARMTRELSLSEQSICSALLDDAEVLIDNVALLAPQDVKKVVSCRMVIRAMGAGSDGTIPVGASQGSIAALGYTQSWTVGSGGGTGELYLGKTERDLLGVGNQIGSASPIEALVPEAAP